MCPEVRTANVVGEHRGVVLGLGVVPAPEYPDTPKTLGADPGASAARAKRQLARRVASVRYSRRA